MSKKIVSVHNHKCTSGCPHKDVCYFVNGKHFDNPDENEADKIEEVIEKISDDIKVYYSGCDFMESFTTFATKVWDDDRKHMTFSKNMLPHMKTMCGPNEINKFNSKVQLTVYTYEDLINPELKDMQKLFLIKNKDSYNIAMRIFKYDIDLNVHFPIAHNWAANNKDLLLVLINEWNNSNNPNLSLDSCLENYVSNGTCVYSEEYIDLRYDGSVRRCPFSDECHKINYENPDAMFDIEFKPNCIYGELFGREEWRNGNTQK